MLSERVVHSLRTKQLVIVILQNQCLGVAPTTKQRYNYFCSDVLFANIFFVILHKNYANCTNQTRGFAYLIREFAYLYETVKKII